MVLATADGATPVLNEVAAHDEAQLQQRLTANPDVIPIEEFGWTGPLMVVGRETVLPSGSVDLIGVARSGEILIAEFKIGPKNPDFRHALAQAVDYGADIWRMSMDEFDAAVVSRYFNGPYCPTGSPTKGCSSLLDAAEKVWGDDWTEEERISFVERVAEALRSGVLHFAVVAQRFTAAMERTVEYMNATATARFYLVELIRFSNGDIDAFEARTVLKPALAKQPTSASYGNAAAFLAAEQDATRRDRLERFFEFCAGINLVVFWGTKGISIKVPTPDDAPPLSIAWVHPTGVTGWGGLSGLALGFDHNSAAQHPSMGSALSAYVAGVRNLPGGRAATAKHLTASVFDSEAEAQNMEDITNLITVLVGKS
jgi:hypothetical protein